MNLRFSTSMFSVFPVLVLFLFSINTNKVVDTEILGHWTYQSASEDGMTYTKHAAFGSRKAGIAFMKNGKLIKKQNAGWCGTPPVSYKNFDGTWEWKNENTLALTYRFWGGTIKEDWEVLSVDNDNLKVKSTNFETVHDQR